MDVLNFPGAVRVDCRIGSLKILDVIGRSDTVVDCRIGSLENTSLNAGASATVDCRIGGRIGGHRLACRRVR